MSVPGGIQSAGVLVANKLAATGVFLDDSSAPQLNVAHTWTGGAINLSAGSNPAQSFSVIPVAAGNTQSFIGPNATFANTLSVPGSTTLGAANVTTSLNVTGPSVLVGNTTVTGSFLTTGSTSIGNVLQVGQTTNTPALNANVITATGNSASMYVETTTALSSASSAFYLSPTWRLKVISSGGLAQQYKMSSGTWVNASVLAPPGLVISIAGLTTPTT